MAWHALPASERAQRVGSVAVQLAFLLLPWLVPAFYLRWRRSILIVERIQFFQWPLLRQPKGAPCVAVWVVSGWVAGCAVAPIPCCAAPVASRETAEQGCRHVAWACCVPTASRLPARCRHPGQFEQHAAAGPAGRPARPHALRLGALSGAVVLHSRPPHLSLLEPVAATCLQA